MDLSVELSGVLSHRLAEITELAIAVERFLQAFDVPDSTIFQINVALEELLTNTISYGYDGNDDQSAIHVSLTIIGREIAVRIEDEAMPFDPFARAAVDTTAGIDERRIGGLGIHFVKEMIDRFDYRRVNGRNVVTLQHSFIPAADAVAAQEAS